MYSGTPAWFLSVSSAPPSRSPGDRQSPADSDGLGFPGCSSRCPRSFSAAPRSSLWACGALCPLSWLLSPSGQGCVAFGGHLHFSPRAALELLPDVLGPFVLATLELPCWTFSAPFALRSRVCCPRPCARSSGYAGPRLIPPHCNLGSPLLPSTSPSWEHHWLPLPGTVPSGTPTCHLEAGLLISSPPICDRLSACLPLGAGSC